MRQSFSWTWTLPEAGVTPAIHEALRSFADDARRIAAHPDVPLREADENELQDHTGGRLGVVMIGVGEPDGPFGEEGIDYMEEYGWGDPFVISVPVEGDSSVRDECSAYHDRYATAVMALLIRAAVTLPKLHILSDGEWGNEWTDARLAIEEIFGESPATIPLNEPDPDTAAEPPFEPERTFKPGPSWLQWSHEDPPGMRPELISLISLEVIERHFNNYILSGTRVWDARVEGVTAHSLPDALTVLSNDLPPLGYQNIEVVTKRHATSHYEMTTVTAAGPLHGIRFVLIERDHVKNGVPYDLLKAGGQTFVSIVVQQLTAPAA